MLLPWKWSIFRGARKKKPHRSKTPPRTRLVLEVLEDRLALSATSLSNLELTHDQWRMQRFALGDAVLANPQEVLNPQNVEASAMQGTSLIGLDRVFANYPYRGDNYSVAIIDTGIDYNHPALGGGWGQRVLTGWDFANNDADPMDDHGHGTHVAGIIGSSNATYTGLAPNVKFIALKVLGADGSGSFAAVEDALQWVAKYQAQFNIVAVNLSLGAGNLPYDPYGFLDDEFATLQSQGVFIAAASGNSFYDYGSQQGLGYPAISSQAVAVGAVWAGNFGQVSWRSGAIDYTTAADRVTSFTQRSAALDILAPGALITSSYRNGGWATMAGTSMATPMIAGAAAILHQALDATGNHSLANQNYILGLMQSTGVSVNDGDDENDNVVNTGLTFKRLDLYAALNAIQPGQTNRAPVLNPIANQNISRGQTSFTVGLSYSDPDGDAVSLSARAYTANGTAVSVVVSFAGNQMTLQRVDPWPTAFTVEVTASDGTARATQTFGVNVINQAPLLAAIANQNMKWSQGSLAIDVVYSDPDGDALLLGAQTRPIITQAYQIDQQLGLYYPGSYYTNYYGYNEKWMQGNGSQWYCLMPNGELRRWAGNMTATLQSSYLLAALDASFYADPSKLWNAPAPVQPQVALAYQGDRLVITPAQGFLGSFYVDVVVTDRLAYTVRTFTVTVTNNAPTLAALADRSMAAGAGQLAIDLAASDADGEPLTFAAAARVIPSQAYQLDQQLGLYYEGSYSTNYYGYQEKWFRGSGAKWYCVLANGEFRRWAGSMAATLQATNLLATFDATYYADPSKLWNAPAPVTPQVSFAFQGNQLVITPAHGYLGSFYVDVRVSDGLASVTRTFTLTVYNNAPTLASLANLTMSAGTDQLTVELNGSDADSDNLNYTAQVQAVPGQAYVLKQQLGLYYEGSYSTNYYGYQEKWFRGSGAQWYCVLPNGEFRRWAGSMAATLQAANLLATFDASFYADPSKLWNAQPPANPTAQLLLEGNRLTIKRLNGYVGTFQVMVTVSDGLATTTRTFIVTGG